MLAVMRMGVIVVLVVRGMFISRFVMLMLHVHLKIEIISRTAANAPGKSADNHPGPGARSRGP